MTEFPPPTIPTRPAHVATTTAPAPTGNGLAITSLILGCCSVLFFWLYGILPIAAIIFGAAAMHQARQANQKPSGMAIAGLTLGIIFTAIFGLIFLAAVSR